LADTKISGLSATAGLALEDLLVVVDDPSGTPVTKKATLTQLAELFQPRIGAQFIGFKLEGANFNSTSDQALVKQGTFTAYRLAGIFVTNASISLTTAAGGVYPTTGKGGTAIVAAGQAYSALTSASVLLTLTLTGNVANVRYTDSPLYLSLTTPQGAAATADVYVAVLAFN